MEITTIFLCDGRASRCDDPQGAAPTSGDRENFDFSAQGEIINCPSNFTVSTSQKQGK